MQTESLSSKLASVNATVPDFLLNAATYLHRVMEGEQVCLVKDGKVQAVITPASTSPALSASSASPAQDWIQQARQLKARLAAKCGADDWMPQGYLAAGQRS